jgi:hypothetical protein
MATKKKELKWIRTLSHKRRKMLNIQIGLRSDGLVFAVWDLASDLGSTPEELRRSLDKCLRRKTPT